MNVSLVIQLKCRVSLYCLLICPFPRAGVRPRILTTIGLEKFDHTLSVLILIRIYSFKRQSSSVNISLTFHTEVNVYFGIQNHR